MADIFERKPSSKHGHPHDETRTKKRRKKEDQGRKRKHRRKGSGDNVQIVDDDPNDDDMWVEKNIDMDGEKVILTRLSFRPFPDTYHPRYLRPIFPPREV